MVRSMVNFGMPASLPCWARVAQFAQQVPGLCQQGRQILR
jgi:hypothetical protein